MTFTDTEGRRTDNQSADKNAPNAPLDKPPPEGEEVVNMFFTSKFWVIYGVDSTQFYKIIVISDNFQAMVIVNPGNGTDSETNKFINDMKEEYAKGKEKVTKWKNNLMNQGSGYSL